MWTSPLWSGCVSHTTDFNSPDTIWLFILLIARYVCCHSRWSLHFQGTYSHTWVFPNVLVGLSVIDKWVDKRMADGYFLPFTKKYFSTPHPHITGSNSYTNTRGSRGPRGLIPKSFEPKTRNPNIVWSSKTNTCLIYPLKFSSRGPHGSNFFLSEHNSKAHWPIDDTYQVWSKLDEKCRRSSLLKCCLPLE